MKKFELTLNEKQDLFARFRERTDSSEPIREITNEESYRFEQEQNQQKIDAFFGEIDYKSMITEFVETEVLPNIPYSTPERLEDQPTIKSGEEYERALEILDRKKMYEEKVRFQPYRAGDRIKNLAERKMKDRIERGLPPFETEEEERAYNEMINNTSYAERYYGKEEKEKNQSTSQSRSSYGTSQSSKPLGQQSRSSDLTSPSSSGASNNSSGRQPSSAPQAKKLGASGNDVENTDIPVSAIKYLDEMTNRVNKIATQRARGWNDTPKEDVQLSRAMKRAPWYKRGMYKMKKFMKSGKGRITTKVGVIIAMQLAMGVIGKRYQFENPGQFAMMFSMMLGSFFVTRELAEDGIDISGLSF